MVDTLSFKVQLDDSDAHTKKTHPISQPTKLTKRIILSKLAGIYDPIGSGTVLIKAKIAMQELWQLELDWDEDVPPNKKTKWTELFKEMALLNDVKLERCLTPLDALNNPWLIIFCDASRLAFSTCAYVRWQLLDGKFSVRFVAAKTRVAPLKELTVPRLELQAAVLASRLAKTILDETRLEIVRIIFFSGSRVVLTWIQDQPRRYKAFVSCRVSEIQSNSDPADWFHCPTSMNVADDLTKGISANEVNGRWFNGPKFLQLPEDQWPMETSAPDKKEVDKERRKVEIVCPLTIVKPIFDLKKILEVRTSN